MIRPHQGKSLPSLVCEQSRRNRGGRIGPQILEKIGVKHLISKYIPWITTFYEKSSKEQIVVFSHLKAPKSNTKSAKLKSDITC